MVKLDTRSIAAVGLLFLVLGLTLKVAADPVRDIPLLEWLACFSVTSGMIALIFALGRRGSASSRSAQTSGARAAKQALKEKSSAR